VVFEFLIGTNLVKSTTTGYKVHLIVEQNPVDKRVRFGFDNGSPCIL
jgi:hypothetical protein